MTVMEFVAAFVTAGWFCMELAMLLVRMPLGEAPKKTDQSSMAVLILTIGASVIIAAVCFIAGRVWGFARMAGAETAMEFGGLAIMAAGLSLRVVSIIQLRKFFTMNITILDGHELMDKGVYRFIRHPSYLGAMALFAGLGVCSANWISLGLLTVPVIAALNYRIVLEEKVLLAHFGARYGEYMKRTKRLVPFLY